VPFLLWLENTLLASSAELPEEIVLITGLGMALVTWAALLLVAHKLNIAQRVLTALVSRIEVLAYLYVPLGSFGLLVVLIRNLF
jgi:hypothetical protein